MRRNGGKQCHAEPGLYFFDCEDGQAICATFEDDALWGFSSPTIETRLKEVYAKEFRAEFATMHRFLNIRFVQNLSAGTTTLDQTEYIEGIYEQYMPEEHAIRKKPPVAPANKTLTLLTSAEARACHTQASAELRSRYLALAGALMYVGHATRPDILMPTTRLAQSSHNPSEAQYVLLLQILAYLYATKEQKTTLDAEESLQPMAMVDADWAVDFSTAGWAIWICGCAVSYASKRERCVALSTTEAELVAASMAAADIIWIRTLLTHLGVEIDAPTLLAIDNAGAAAIAVDPAMRSALKHVSRRHYYIRDMVDAEEIRIARVDTLDNVADIMTKPMPPERHRLMSGRLRGGGPLGRA
jgi:hypothetical protein